MIIFFYGIINKGDNMKLLKLECPSCGAQLEINGDLKKFTCNYCGKISLLDEEIINVNVSGNVKSSKLQNAIQDLNDIFENGNYDEAYKEACILIDKYPKNQEINNIMNKLLDIKAEEKRQQIKKMKEQEKIRLEQLKEQEIIKQIHGRIARKKSIIIIFIILFLLSVIGASIYIYNMYEENVKQTVRSNVNSTLGNYRFGNYFNLIFNKDSDFYYFKYLDGSSKTSNYIEYKINKNNYKNIDGVKSISIFCYYNYEYNKCLEQYSYIIKNYYKENVSVNDFEGKYSEFNYSVYKSITEDSYIIEDLNVCSSDNVCFDRKKIDSSILFKITF